MQQGLRLSYRELLRQADEVARGLLQLGVQVRVSLLLFLFLFKNMHELLRQADEVARGLLQLGVQVGPH